ncbi:MAG: ProQ/FinO family protein [Candidatus Competibacter denitrificans]
MTESQESIRPISPKTQLLPLVELFPLCFNWEQPQPLKLKIHHDLMNLGYDKALIKRSLRSYCLRPRYRYRVRAGAMRVDLQGEPAGVVTEEEAIQSRQAMLAAAERKAVAEQALPPSTTPLPEENLVPGRLDLTVKFSELPKPLMVQGGLKIGIQTGEGIVTAVLPSKMWKKLEQAAAHYPAWVAALSGSLGQVENGEIALKNPAVQIFEKKARAAIAPDGVATEVPTPSVPASATRPAPATTPTAPITTAPTAKVSRATLSLKSKPPTDQRSNAADPKG